MRWWDLLAIVLCYTSWDRRYLTVEEKLLWNAKTQRDMKNKCPREKWTARVRKNEEELCHFFSSVNVDGERKFSCYEIFLFLFNILNSAVDTFDLFVLFVYAACNLLDIIFISAADGVLCMHHQVVDQSSTTSSRTCITTENKKKTQEEIEKKIHSTLSIFSRLLAIVRIQ